MEHERVTIIAKERELSQFYSELKRREVELTHVKDALNAQRVALAEKEAALNLREKNLDLRERLLEHAGNNDPFYNDLKKQIKNKGRLYPAR